MIEQREKTQIKTKQRPPIAVVLGHVDHGKTSLLDKIREANVALKEAGGITQSIGAYEIIHTSHESRTDADGHADSRGKKITFIDTPGHEAFSKMRSRGAKVADLAILVVAADEGVKPQTKEAIEIIKDAGIPFVVAINKIDKSNADIEKTKNELTAENVLLEGYGGNISFQPISAKTGEGVDDLLDLVLLAAELEDLPFNPSAPGRGIILESKMDSRRGVIATGIIKDGLIKTGDLIYSESASGKVKCLENFLGERIESAAPSAPVLILGFESLPEIGEEFVCESLGKAGMRKAHANEMRTMRKETEDKKVQTISDAKEGGSELCLILKADVSGSLEVLTESIKNIPIPEKAVIKIINQSVGDISDGDIKTAISGDAIIVGFKVSVTRAAENLARAHNVKVIASDVIYELVKSIKEEFENLGKEVIKGDLEVLATFGKKVGKQIVGGKVVEGQIQNNSTLEIQRGDKLLGSGKLINLQQAKKDADSVQAGNECGLLIESNLEIKIGDHLLLR